MKIEKYTIKGYEGSSVHYINDTDKEKIVWVLVGKIKKSVSIKPGQRLVTAMPVYLKK